MLNRLFRGTLLATFSLLFTAIGLGGPAQPVAEPQSEDQKYAGTWVGSYVGEERTEELSLSLRKDEQGQWRGSYKFVEQTGDQVGELSAIQIADVRFRAKLYSPDGQLEVTLEGLFDGDQLAGSYSVFPKGSTEAAKKGTFKVNRSITRNEQSQFSALQFLLGDWEALSKPGEPGGSFSFTREVQGRVITRRNHAEYPAAGNHPASTHDDLMVIYQEGAALRADYFDNEGHVIRYTVQSSAEGQVTLISEAAANAPRYRLSYTRLANGNVSGKFEIAPPGKSDAFTQYLAWEAKRK